MDAATTGQATQHLNTARNIAKWLTSFALMLQALPILDRAVRIAMLAVAGVLLVAQFALFILAKRARRKAGENEKG